MFARSRLRLLLLVLLACAGSACRVDTDVDIAVGQDGSGSVTVTARLDKEAADRLGGPDRLRLDDLKTAGWSVTGPEPSDGGLRIAASKRFGRPQDLQAVLDEVAPGVVTGATIEVTDGFASTTYRVQGDVRLSGDPAQFGDAALTEALGGVGLGRSPAQLASEGATAADAYTVQVNASVPEGKGSTSRLSASGGVPAEGRFDVTAETGTPLPMALIAAGAVLAVVALGLAIRSRRR